jgi:hypothetical protein
MLSFRTGPKPRDVIPNRAPSPVRNLLFAPSLLVCNGHSCPLTLLLLLN